MTPFNQRNITYLILGLSHDCLRGHFTTGRSQRLLRPTIGNWLRGDLSTDRQFHWLRRLYGGLRRVLHLFSWGILAHNLVLNCGMGLRKLVVLRLLRGRLINNGLLRGPSSSGVLLLFILYAYLGLRCFRLAE